MTTPITEAELLELEKLLAGKTGYEANHALSAIPRLIADLRKSREALRQKEAELDAALRDQAELDCRCGEDCHGCEARRARAALGES